MRQLKVGLNMMRTSKDSLNSEKLEMLQSAHGHLSLSVGRVNEVLHE